MSILLLVKVYHVSQLHSALLEIRESCDILIIIIIVATSSVSSPATEKEDEEEDEEERQSCDPPYNIMHVKHAHRVTHHGSSQPALSIKGVHNSCKSPYPANDDNERQP